MGSKRGYRCCVLAMTIAATLPASGSETPRVDPADVPRYWIIESEFEPQYLPQSMVSGLEGCYVADYTIALNGEVVDPEISRSETKFARKVPASRAGANRQRAAIRDAQAAAVLAAVRGMRFGAATGNPDRRAIRTRTLPIVFTMQNFERPGDPAAVRKEMARQAEASEAWSARCSGDR